MSEKHLKRISETNLGLFVLGESLIALSAGSLYWIRLVRYSHIIFIAAVLLASYYISVSLLHIHRNQRINHLFQLIGFLSVFLLLFLFGIQSPQLPLKRLLLILGLILVLPALKDLVLKREQK